MNVLWIIIALFAVVISSIIFLYLCIYIVLQYVRFLKMEFLGQRVYPFKILINITNSPKRSYLRTTITVVGKLPEF